MFNHDKNYTELCIENYLKHFINILIKFCTFKTFRPVNIKLKVVNKCRAC